MEKIVMRERARSMSYVRAFKSQTQLEYFVYSTLTISLLLLPHALAAVSYTPSVSLPGCPDKCGDITIPYPFGTRPGCYSKGFALTCNESTVPPKLFVGLQTSSEGAVEVMDIDIISSEVRALTFIAYHCYNETKQTYKTKDWLVTSHGTYLLSPRRNIFIVVGCHNMANIVGTVDVSYQSGCASFCKGLNSTTGRYGGSCNGLGCCQTIIPAGLSSYEVKWFYNENPAWRYNPCVYAMVAEVDWYKFQVQDLIAENFLKRTQKTMPFILDWAIRKNGTCLDSETNKIPHSACLSKNSRCHNTSNGVGYICKCLPGYSGNPYIPDGCMDINECSYPDEHPCHGKCINTEGGYQCFCPKGTRGDAKAGSCDDIFPYAARMTVYCAVGGIVLMGICFLTAIHHQRKRHAKQKAEYHKYYQMMDSQLHVFSKKQLEIATNNFSETNEVGAGGQGKVYRGLLQNNQVVAVKKSKEVEETQREEFVNEILLLSQINHRNIVRLLGCCLEGKIPMLVYEFVPNGTLFELLHGKNKSRPISLHTRLSVALESAEALDYLHSSISQTILHGDVKSANILLDDGDHAKVSDFGASNLVPSDETQVVKVVQGTRGYLDPEYVATAVLTKKSDVYSFGVVLLELITRKSAIFIDEMQEKKHLASCFVSNASKSEFNSLLDEEIITTKENMTIKVIQEVSELAVCCLNVRGDDRPTMRQVVEKLQNLVTLHKDLPGPEVIHEGAEKMLCASTSYAISDTSAFNNYGSSSVLDIETTVPE